MNIYAFSIAPVTMEFRNKLLGKYQQNIFYLTVQEIKQLSLLQMVMFLRKVSAEKLLLVIEDENSLPMLPVLKILGFFTRAKQLEVINPQLESEPFKRIKTFGLSCSLLLASFKALVRLLRCHYELIHLHKAEVIAVKNNQSKTAIHMNTNLWLGIKAGGSVAHISGVVNALNNTELDTSYASVASKNPLIRSSIKHLCLEPPKVWGIPFELNYYYFNHYAYQQLSAKVQTIKPQFIYSRLSLINYTSVKLSRHYKIPLIIEYNGSEVWVSKNWGKNVKFPKPAQLAEEVCLKHAHVIITISEVLYDELIARGIDKDKIVYYPNCVDPEIFSANNFSDSHKYELRSKYNIPNDAVVLTFIGTFGKWHGIEFLAQTIVHLVSEKKAWLDKHKIKFLLVGDGSEMPVVKTILQDKVFADYVILTGLIPQNQAPLYLASSDILLSPHIPNADGSKFFGSPTKLFEYMAMEKGIIAADLEQIGKILQNSLTADRLPNQITTADKNELAILYEPCNSQQFITAMEFLVENPKWIKKLGANARQEVIKNYTWDKHVKLILDKFYERVPN